MSHTPGPWSIDPDYHHDEGYAYIDAPTHGALAEVVVRMESEEEPSEELLSNANIIVAAPEMLEALKSIENDDDRIPEAIWELRNKAIAKAEGK